MTPSNTTEVRALADVSLGKLNESQKLATQSKVDRMVNTITLQEAAAASRLKTIKAKTDALVGFIVANAKGEADEAHVSAAVASIKATEERIKQLAANQDSAKSALAELVADAGLDDSVEHRLNDLLGEEHHARCDAENITEAKADLLAFEFPKAIDLVLPTDVA